MGHLEPRRIHLIQMENVDGLKLGWIAAGLLNPRPAAPALPLRLQMEQRLEQRVVISRQVARRALTAAIEGVKLRRLHDKAEAFQLAQLDGHVLAAAGAAGRPPGPAVRPPGV
ncbi:MAG: hypothetical protein ACK56I_07435, partial [bacterium]